ncbi:MAG: hypothetical protein MK095_06265 [Phycisphaerales bacterium]|nr:hypothetical protein [Phycisphaerales bacterium]
MRLLLLLLLPLLTAACGVDATFPDRKPDQLWKALKAVAENPDYDHADPTKRWTVVENIVHVDEVHRRIDIDRHLKRLLHRPRTNPLYEDVQWRFQIHMYPTDPLSVRFESIDPSLPTKAQFEGDRYFAAVHRFLSGLPRPTPSDDAATDTEPSS